MPITYYTKEEYDTKRLFLEGQATVLCHQLKKKDNEPCRMDFKEVSCGDCRYNDSCYSVYKYFCK